MGDSISDRPDSGEPKRMKNWNIVYFGNQTLFVEGGLDIGLTAEDCMRIKWDSSPFSALLTAPCKLEVVTQPTCYFD